MVSSKAHQQLNSLQTHFRLSKQHVKGVVTESQACIEGLRVTLMGGTFTPVVAKFGNIGFKASNFGLAVMFVSGLSSLRFPCSLLLSISSLVRRKSRSPNLLLCLWSGSFPSFTWWWAANLPSRGRWSSGTDTTRLDGISTFGTVLGCLCLSLVRSGPAFCRIFASFLFREAKRTYRHNARISWNFLINQHRAILCEHAFRNGQKIGLGNPLFVSYFMERKNFDKISCMAS